MRLSGPVLRRNSRLSDCRTRTMRLRGCLLGQSSRRLAVSGGSADKCDSEPFPCSLPQIKRVPQGLIQETTVKVTALVFPALLGGNLQRDEYGFRLWKSRVMAHVMGRVAWRLLQA